MFEKFAISKTFFFIAFSKMPEFFVFCQLLYRVTYNNVFITLRIPTYCRTHQNTFNCIATLKFFFLYLLTFLKTVKIKS